MRAGLPLSVLVLCHHQCPGAKSRGRTPDDVERAISRATGPKGVRHFLITDDNFARHKGWEAIFDRITLLRERTR